jgi:hypothetical protein
VTARKSPGALAALGAIEMDELGQRVVSETSRTNKFTQALIRATLIGLDRCEAQGIIARGAAPVLAMCRALVAAGHDSATPLEGYRGPILCMRVRSIGEGAALEVDAHGTGFRRRRDGGAAPPVAENVPSGPRQRPPVERAPDAPSRRRAAL